MKYKPKKKFMKLAIKEAINGNKKGGKYPIGAVIVKGNRVIAKSCNGLPSNIDPTAHAEIIAIKKAAKKLSSRYLDDCILYTTNEPCAMCSGAMVWANMNGLVFGASVQDMKKFWKPRRDKKTSGRKFIFIPAEKVLEDSEPKITITKNFMRGECLKLFNLYDPDIRR
jgi:tRNA(Arg) A34 adenosine deaminase TadA